MPDLRIRVRGVDYGGWKTVRVARGIDRLAGSFEVAVSELWPGNAAAREILPGDPVEVLAEGEIVITGWVDDVEVEHAAREHSVTISGRDATGDLVDCGAVHAGGEWVGQKLEQIVRDLLAPFGIPVRVETDTGAPFGLWQINQGETVHANIERMTRHRGVLVVSNGRGGVTIKTPSRALIGGAYLILGHNIMEATAKRSNLDRFSRYIVRGQYEPSDDTPVADCALLSAEAADGAVKRYRPSVIMAEDVADTDGLQRRAVWERNVHAGRSLGLSITAQGWRHPGGSLWPFDGMVPVKDSLLRADRQLYIVGTTMRLDDKGGARTEIALAPPEAYELIAFPETVGVLEG